jgi:hypothetical protein
MSYKKIDPILQQWAKANGLHIYKEYQEGEVRSAERRSGPRSGWQIWVDKPNQDGLIGVHVWDFTKAKKRRSKTGFPGLFHRFKRIPELRSDNCERLGVENVRLQIHRIWNKINA